MQLNSKFWFDVFLKIRVFSALVNPNMAEFFAKRGGGPKKRPRIFYTFEQVKAILEENKLIQHCKTTCLLPNDFSEYIYHVGSSHDTHSIIQSGVVLGGKDVPERGGPEPPVLRLFGTLSPRALA